MGYQSQTAGLESLQPPDATVPETRIKDAGKLQDILQGFIDKDLQGGRSWKRAKVQSIVDGNPPYSAARLAKLGRKDATNVNFGTARSFLAQAEGIFFDLATEAPTMLVIRTDPKKGTEEQRVEWGNTMTEVAHDILNRNPKWQYVLQCSQKQMTLQGCGPLWFEDKHRIIPRQCIAGDLLVPENVESETDYWELSFIKVDYKVHELWKFIEDEDAATARGWDVDYVKQVIMHAVPKQQAAPYTQNWEWVQQQFKQNSYASFWDTDVIQCAHCWWVEFGGRITHAIIEQRYQTSSPAGDKKEPDMRGEKSSAVQFLFRNIGRYENWHQCVHPMYYDKGNGTHYSVTGIGVPMYSAMAIENRLRCNLVDKAMAPKLIFKRMADSKTPFDLKPMGDYSVLSSGFDLQQTSVSGLLEDGMVMLNELGRTMSANLAEYRQGLSRDGSNPLTAKEAGIRYQQQFSVKNTAISRYYQQLDHLFAEIVRRLCDLNSPEKEAHEFQERCKERGVEPECFGRVTVEANRVVGAGSAALRQSALDKIMGLLPHLPEDGQQNLVSQWIAAYAGQRSVRLFNPQRKQTGMGNEQEAQAMLQVAGMKTGVPPVVTSEQNPVVYASTFLGAAGQALATVQQGANPLEVLKFVDAAVPAAMVHMRRFGQDPTRKPLVKQMGQMVKQIESVADQLRKQVGEQMQKQQAQRKNGAQLPPEIQQKLAIQAAQGQLKIQQMQLSHRQRLQQRAEQHRMELAAAANRVNLETASADLKTASEIKRNRLKSLEE